MPKLKRSVAVKLMEVCGFETASVLSTNRLQKKLNRLDRVTIKAEMDEAQEDVLSFVLEALSNGHTVEIEDDRTNIPKYEQQNKAAAGRGGNPRGGFIKKFDGNKNKYDWNQIFNGKVNVLEKGPDFDCKPATFALQARAAAKRRGIQAQIACRGEQVVVQSGDKE